MHCAPQIPEGDVAWGMRMVVAKLRLKNMQL